MKTENIERYLESFGKYIIKQSRTNLTKAKKNLTKDLYNSLKFTVKKRNNTVRKTSAPLAGFKRIRSSNGDVERRPYIKTDILMDGITKNIELTLTDRGPMDYTMLIGRKALGRRWMVNPSISFLTSPNGNSNKNGKSKKK